MLLKGATTHTEMMISSIFFSKLVQGTKVLTMLVFWCDLFLYFPEYKELSRLAILVLTIATVTWCECERGFSTMNFVKNELRTAMTNTTLNACMAVGMIS